MKKATKAAVISALLFPGAGHFLFRRYITGTLLAGTALASLYLLLARIVETAAAIAGKIQSGEVQPDISTITELISKQTTGADTLLLNTAWTVFIICWVVGIIDSYRIGRAEDKSRFMQN